MELKELGQPIYQEEDLEKMTIAEQKADDRRIEKEKKLLDAKLLKGQIISLKRELQQIVVDKIVAAPLVKISDEDEAGILEALLESLNYATDLQLIEAQSVIDEAAENEEA